MTRSASTRQRIQKVALNLFRKKGFQATTMREIAKAAKTSLGAAYYYFPSKDALVLAYFEQQIDEHEARCKEVFEKTQDLAERVEATLMVRFELMKHDKKFFGGLLRAVGDENSSVNVFSPENRELRARALRLCERALDVPEVPADLRRQAALALWTLTLGMVLYFVHDDSPGARCTQRLIHDLVGLAVPVLPLLALPEVQSFRERLFAVLDQAGLVPEPATGEPPATVL